MRKVEVILSKNYETYTESLHGYIPLLSYASLKGTFRFKVELYNDDEFVWICFEGEVAFY